MTTKIRIFSYQLQLERFDSQFLQRQSSALASEWRMGSHGFGITLLYLSGIFAPLHSPPLSFLPVQPSPLCRLSLGDSRPPKETLKLNLTMNKRPRTQQTLQIEQLLQAGQSQTSIARQFGISQERVRQIKRRTLKSNHHQAEPSERPGSRSALERFPSNTHAAISHDASAMMSTREETTNK